MNDFFREHLVVHTHIEKTAGSSLTRGLVEAFGEDRVWDIRGKQHPKPEFISVEDRARIFLLTGHFQYGTHNRFFDRRPVYIACVRPPLERLRSHYDFVRARPGHPTHSRVVGKSLREVVDDLKRHKAALNIMTRALTGLAHISEDKLLKHVEDNYLIVTPSHRVNDTLRALIPLLAGGEPDTEQHRKKTAEPSSEDIGDLKQWFEDANYLDVRLAQFTDANYDRWLKELPDRLARSKRSVAS
jgi:hypothetical protein